MITKDQNNIIIESVFKLMKEGYSISFKPKIFQVIISLEKDDNKIQDGISKDYFNDETIIQTLEKLSDKWKTQFTNIEIK